MLCFFILYYSYYNSFLGGEVTWHSSLFRRTTVSRLSKEILYFCIGFSGIQSCISCLDLTFKLPHIQAPRSPGWSITLQLYLNAPLAWISFPDYLLQITHCCFLCPVSWFSPYPSLFTPTYSLHDTRT